MGGLEKTEQEPIFVKKLKKTETVKLKIDENKMESVELKHHDFEPCPQDNNNEELSKLSVGEPLQYTDETQKSEGEKESTKKLKKVKAKKEDVTDSEDFTKELSPC